MAITAELSTAITFFAFLLHVHVLDWLLVGLTIWVAAFFRDPIRTTPHGDNLIVAPADGLEILGTPESAKQLEEAIARAG